MGGSYRGIQMFLETLLFVSMSCPFACAPNENYPNTEYPVEFLGSGEGAVTMCVVYGALISEGEEGSLLKMQISWALLRTTELGSFCLKTMTAAFVFV